MYVLIEHTWHDDVNFSLFRGCFSSAQSAYDRVVGPDFARYRQRGSPALEAELHPDGSYTWSNEDYELIRLELDTPYHQPT